MAEFDMWTSYHFENMFFRPTHKTTKKMFSLSGNTLNSKKSRSVQGLQVGLGY